MRKTAPCYLHVAIVLACLGAGELLAQDVVVNGDFETGMLSPHWTLFGQNKHTRIALFETSPGKESLCLERMPGPPDGNGGVEMGVHLEDGRLYLFLAKIAAHFCSI